MANRLKSVGGGAASDSAAQTEQETSPLARGGISPREFEAERAGVVDSDIPTLLMHAGEALVYARDRIDTHETLARLALAGLPKKLPDELDISPSVLAGLDDARALLRLLRSDIEDAYAQFFQLGAIVEEMAARLQATKGAQ